MSDPVETLARLLQEAAGRAVALTGAGVSTESGVPDFRSPAAGVWQHHDPMEVASIDGFTRDPRAFYAFWGERFGMLREAPPNATHRMLAGLEARGLLCAVVTQNIDGLHQRAGSKDVLEVHGTFERARCLECERVEKLDAVMARISGGRLPVCQVCGGLVKPDVVLFGELLPEAFTVATRRIRQSALLLAMGSSLQVYPVAGLVDEARDAGAKVVIVNREETPYDGDADLVIHDELGAFSERLARRLSL